MIDEFTYIFKLYTILIWMIKTIIIESEKEQVDCIRDIGF